ncbi:hypothetical protein K474DRAFT_1515270 [Panus rudis PR-1116 ss-1]|nr:hypothetical protein K474DRAFT_1515270 [Panus rudis PR-1116 ss-1]
MPSISLQASFRLRPRCSLRIEATARNLSPFTQVTSRSLRTFIDQHSWIAVGVPTLTSALTRNHRSFRALHSSTEDARVRTRRCQRLLLTVRHERGTWVSSLQPSSPKPKSDAEAERPNCAQAALGIQYLVVLQAVTPIEQYRDRPSWLTVFVTLMKIKFRSQKTRDRTANFTDEYYSKLRIANICSRHCIPRR